MCFCDLAKFLVGLGLALHPPLTTVLTLVEEADPYKPVIASVAFEYLSRNWANYETEYNDKNNKEHIANLKVIPAEDQNDTCRMAKISEIYNYNRSSLPVIHAQAGRLRTWNGVG